MEYKEQAFDDIFDNIYYNIRMQAITDPEFTIKKLESLLNAQYDYEGHNPDNSGSVHGITIAATIAAFEAVLAEWKDGFPETESKETDA